jgi:hypothetical protein
MKAHRKPSSLILIALSVSAIACDFRTHQEKLLLEGGYVYRGKIVDGEYSFIDPQRQSQEILDFRKKWESKGFKFIQEGDSLSIYDQKNKKIAAINKKQQFEALVSLVESPHSSKR